MNLEIKGKNLRSAEYELQNLRRRVRDLEGEVSELKSRKRFGLFR